MSQGQMSETGSIPALPDDIVTSLPPSPCKEVSPVSGWRRQSPSVHLGTERLPLKSFLSRLLLKVLEWA